TKPSSPVTSATGSRHCSRREVAFVVQALQDTFTCHLDLRLRQFPGLGETTIKKFRKAPVGLLHDSSPKSRISFLRRKRDRSNRIAIAPREVPRMRAMSASLYLWTYFKTRICAASGWSAARACASRLCVSSTGCESAAAEI